MTDNSLVGLNGKVNIAFKIYYVGIGMFSAATIAYLMMVIGSVAQKTAVLLLAVEGSIWFVLTGIYLAYVGLTPDSITIAKTEVGSDE